MEKWKSWAIGIGASWVLLAFIAWQTESDCGFFFNSACWPEIWLGMKWLVLFRWAKEYGTFFAALIAILSAYIVWRSSQENLEHLRKSAERQTIQNYVSTFHGLSHIFHRAFERLNDDDLDISFLNNIEMNQYHIFNNIHSRYAYLPFGVTQLLLEITQRRQFEPKAFERAALTAYAAAQVFRQSAEMLEKDGNIKRLKESGRCIFKADEVVIEAERLGLGINDIDFLAGFFVIDQAD